MRERILTDRYPEPDARQRRVVELSISLLGLVVLAPLLAVIAVLIKLDSPGPVFFIQKRVGRFERPFTVFKFRSMRRAREDEQTVPQIDDIEAFRFRPPNFEARVT